MLFYTAFAYLMHSFIHFSGWAFRAANNKKMKWGKWETIEREQKRAVVPSIWNRLESDELWVHILCQFTCWNIFDSYESWFWSQIVVKFFSIVHILLVDIIKWSHTYNCSHSTFNTSLSEFLLFYSVYFSAHIYCCKNNFFVAKNHITVCN